MRLLPLLLLAPACAASSARQADLSSELAGRTAGPPRDCIPASAGDSLVARDSQTLVYRRGDTIWVNRLAAPCPGLHPMSTLIVEVHGSSHCRGDPVRALPMGSRIAGPVCGLGDFVPYRRAG